MISGRTASKLAKQIFKTQETVEGFLEVPILSNYSEVMVLACLALRTMESFRIVIRLVILLWPDFHGHSVTTVGLAAPPSTLDCVSTVWASLSVWVSAVV